MKTREEWIAIHQKNVAWANDQIRICLMARRLLKGQEQKNFDWLIRDANEHNRPELIPLKDAIEKYRESWRLRFQNYSLALLSTIFDIKKFIFEARSLKWEEQAMIENRLEYLRTELRAERISYGELAELQSLAEHIKPDDVELLEAAGVPEFETPA